MSTPGFPPSDPQPNSTDNPYEAPLHSEPPPLADYGQYPMAQASPDQRPASVIVLSILHWLWGAFGLLGTLGGIFGVLLMSGALGQNASMPAGGVPVTWLAISVLLGFVLVVIQLIGSTGLFCRRAWGVTWLRVYSWVYIVLSLINVAINFLYPTPMPPNNPMAALMPVFQVLGVLFALALPIATLIVLRRNALKDWIAGAAQSD